MNRGEQIVLSASRRTDIPAFYLDWFMAGIDRGAFEVIQPYTHRRRQVPADPGQVHSIVFWSKDFGAFLRRRIGERLQASGFHLFFNFTVNPENRLLEPRVPPLAARLGQMAELAARFGPQTVQWRFDPICHYRRQGGERRSNLAGFEGIAEAAAEARIRRCITSFADLYAKVVRRAGRIGLVFEDPPLHEKAKILERMAARLAPMGIGLETCCENDVLQRLGPKSPVRAASCIPSDRLMALYGGRLSLHRDTGQRRRFGCGCRVSVDIGSYALHPCRHDCLFCYARPAGSAVPARSSI